MKDKYGDKGFNIYAVTKEAPGAVESKGITPFKINYFVGVVDDATVKSYGVRGWPTHFVVDPEGKIVQGPFHGMVDTKAVDEYVAKVAPREITSSLTGAAKKAGKHFDKGAYGKAYEKAGEIVEDEEADSAEKADAEKVKKLVSTMLERKQKQVKSAEEAKDYVTVFNVLEEIEDGFKGMKAADEAKEKAKKLKRDDSVKKEMGAQKDLAKLVDQLEKAKGKSKEAIKDRIRKFIEKNSGTVAAKKAEEHIK